MLSEEKSHLETSLREAQYYFNRELSWLEFNYRVLHEALDARTPLLDLGVAPGHPFPHLSNLSFNGAVVVKNPKTEEERVARVKVPDILPRFVELPQELPQFDEGQKIVWAGVPLEQAIAHNLSSLFPGLEIQGFESSILLMRRFHCDEQFNNLAYWFS